MLNKVLVVDDEPMILQLFKDILAGKGYLVVTAETGERALDILKRENIQVMFLDQNLPGMTGYELCKKIRKEKSAAVLYAMTGYTSLFELMHCREIGFDDYFPKPISVRSIVKATAEAFDKIDRWNKAVNAGKTPEFIGMEEAI